MAPRLSKEQEQQRESTARCALEQLVEYLMNAASDAWHDQRLWGHGDRARYAGRGADLITTVDKLSKVILEHPDAGVRADRLNALHDMLEAAAIIGGCLNTPAAKRLRAVALTEERRAQAQASLRTAEIIEDEFNKLREKFPNKDFQKDGPWKTARSSLLQQSVNQRLEQEDRPKLKKGAEADTIGRHLYKLPFFSVWRSRRSRRTARLAPADTADSD
jgi:hypothetical protein